MDAGVATFDQSTYHIHQTIMWLCTVIGIAVYCAMIYSIIYHRKLNKPDVAEIHVRTKMEIFWTLTSFLIFITLAIPAMQDLLNMKDTTTPEPHVAPQPTGAITLGNYFMIYSLDLYITDE